MRTFLTEGTLPQDDKIKERIAGEVDNFVVEDDTLFRKVRNGKAPYIEFIFRGDLMEKIHHQYGHLSFGSLKNIIESRAWWPSMDYDLRAFVSACPNCQTHQRHRSTQEREEHQVVSDPFIQLHDHSNGYPGRTSTLSDWLQTRVMIQHKLSTMS